MNKAVHLKNFSEEELILSREEAKKILNFFWPQMVAQIDNAIITDEIRGFAQGLLVEAIDATYAMGYVEATFKAIYSAILPFETSHPAVTILKTFSKKASAHWFKHATARDIMNVKIYESIRSKISDSFKSILKMHLNGVADSGPHIQFVNYASISSKNNSWAWF